MQPDHTQRCSTRNAGPAGFRWLLLLALLPLFSLRGFPVEAGKSIEVTRKADLWEIAGSRQRVTFSPTTLRIQVFTAGTRVWSFRESVLGDLLVRHGAKDVRLQFSSARKVQCSPYATGYGTGLKATLAGFQSGEENLDLEVQLLLTLERAEESLQCEILATDGADRIRELAWPGACQPESFDTTVVPFMQGMLLPKDWREKAWLYDTLSYGRGLYMPWWGHQQGTAAMLTQLETPVDAGCHFDHPAGGPTRIGVRWVGSLDRWTYARRVRFCFLDQGDYVDLAKLYRKHAIETGRFVSLREKIARNPKVESLIGVPVIHTSILYHIQPDSSYYQKDNPAANHQLVTFTNRALELEKLAASGIPKAYVHLDGWGFRGYDNLHPDILPPCPDAGGWEGMKHFADVCSRLGFVFAVHDQYRDYYLDARSYDPRHTIIEESGQRPGGSTWYGGKQSILCSRLAPGYVLRNHREILAHGVRLQGAYLDVFSVVPPDECYSPEHPVTRQECLQYRAESLNLVRSWGGIVSSEEPSDWSTPYLDLVHHGPYALRPGPGSGPAMGIPVPLFNLVYHDALLQPWSLVRGAWGIPEKDLGFLHGLGNGGLPYLGLSPSAEERHQVTLMTTLHKRVALVEMTRHRFLDASRASQLFEYADGTRVTINLKTDAFEIAPPLPAGGK